MGAGGIIQHHVKVLLDAVTDPSIYTALSEDDKDRVELIRAENPLARTDDDVHFLVKKIRKICCGDIPI